MRRGSATLRSVRAKRDEFLVPNIERVWYANMRVYGAEKVWKQNNREEIAVARGTVERLMRPLALEGVRRDKSVRTTTPDTSTPYPLDRVNRQFQAVRPNQLWASDFTSVLTWQGWRFCTTMTTDFVLDALDQPLYDRQRDREVALNHHSDRGSEYVCIRDRERLPEVGFAPSVGSKGDSYDAALAETINGR